MAEVRPTLQERPIRQSACTTTGKGGQCGCGSGNSVARGHRGVAALRPATYLQKPILCCALAPEGGNAAAVTISRPPTLFDDATPEVSCSSALLRAAASAAATGGQALRAVCCETPAQRTVWMHCDADGVRRGHAGTHHTTPQQPTSAHTGPPYPTHTAPMPPHRSTTPIPPPHQSTPPHHPASASPVLTVLRAS